MTRYHDRIITRLNSLNNKGYFHLKLFRGHCRNVGESSFVLIAKVRVDGSNPFARSSQTNKTSYLVGARSAPLGPVGSMSGVAPWAFVSASFAFANFRTLRNQRSSAKAASHW